MKARRRRGAITEEDMNKDVDNCIPDLPSRVRVTFFEQVDYKMEMDSSDDTTGNTEYGSLNK